jgi:hypothetical protein
MSNRLAWPGNTNPITEIRFALMAGFDAEGQPMYATGEVASSEECKEIQSILECLKPVPHSITSVTMGEVIVELADKNRITLRPVFHPSRNCYSDLFFVDERQYPMPPSMAELLERWRKRGR